MARMGHVMVRRPIAGRLRDECRDGEWQRACRRVSGMSLDFLSDSSVYRRAGRDRCAIDLMAGTEDGNADAGMKGRRVVCECSEPPGGARHRWTDTR